MVYGRMGVQFPARIKNFPLTAMSTLVIGPPCLLSTAYWEFISDELRPGKGVEKLRYIVSVWNKEHTQVIPLL
jgi:hypothetical protein